MNSMVIETPRLILRQFKEDDVEALHRILSDPITMRFWPSPFSTEQSKAWLDQHLRNYHDLGYGRYAVISKDHQVLIGHCGITSSEIGGTPENDLGYIIFRDFWRQGYATEAAQACKSYGISTLNLRRICANMAADHTASHRVAEKLGMRREREFYNKRNRDILTYLYSYEIDQPASQTDA